MERGSRGFRRQRMPPELVKGLILEGLMVLFAEFLSEKKIEMLDRTKVLHGPQTQTYGETRHSKSPSAR